MNIYTEEIINFYGKKNRCLFIEMLNQKKHLRFLNLHKISKENEKKIINFFLHSNDDICFGKNEFCIKKGIFDNLRSVNSICNIYDYDGFNIHDSNIKYYTEALSIIFDKTKKDKFYRYNKKNLAKNIILSHLIGILSFNTAFNFDSKESIDFLEDSFFFDSEMQSLVIRILKYYKEKNYTGDSLKDKVINNTTIYRNFVKTISNKKSTHFESTLIKITKFSFINSDFDIMEKSFSLKIASSILGVDFIIINSNIKSMEENYRKAEEERKRNIFENNEKIRKEKEKYKNHEKLKSRWREHQKKHNFMDYSVDLANNFSSFMKLGIHPTRDIRRVKKAYYDLIKKWHPDQIEYKSQQTKLEYTEKMKEINSAYEKITKNLT